MATITSSSRKRKKKAEPGRFACKIYFIDHVPGRPPYCMKTKDFEDRLPLKLAAVLDKFKGLVAGTRDTEKGGNWSGRVNWAAIYEDGSKMITEFRDWERDGLPYWKDVSH